MVGCASEPTWVDANRRDHDRRRLLVFEWYVFCALQGFPWRNNREFVGLCLEPSLQPCLDCALNLPISYSSLLALPSLVNFVRLAVWTVPKSLVLSLQVAKRCCITVDPVRPNLLRRAQPSLPFKSGVETHLLGTGPLAQIFILSMLSQVHF